jgi:hypothetical protein
MRSERQEDALADADELVVEAVVAQERDDRQGLWRQGLWRQGLWRQGFRREGLGHA